MTVAPVKSPSLFAEKPVGQEGMGCRLGKKSEYNWSSKLGYIHISTGYIHISTGYIHISTGYIHISTGYLHISTGYIHISTGYIHISTGYIHISTGSNAQMFSANLNGFLVDGFPMLGTLAYWIHIIPQALSK